MIGWLITAAVFLLAAKFLPGIQVTSFWTALFAAIVLSALNLFLKPILLILTLPVNILTLGFFTFVINAGLILLVSSVISGFVVSGFLPALYLALIVAVVNVFIP